jgi:tRNA A-37 threonylcarbamoyl transferase component Bud32
MLSHFLRKLGAVAGRRPTGAVRAGGLIWHLAPGAARLVGPDPAGWEAAAHAEVIKRNLQRTITRVRVPGGTVYVKRCRANTPRAWCREVLRPAKATLEFENALTLRKLGLPAVEPVACGTAPGPLPGDSVLITRGERAGSFLDLLERGTVDRRVVARELAAFLARLHDAGVSHPDPHPGNLLAEPRPDGGLRFVLTDLHAVRFGPPLSWAETRANLVMLNRWFQLRATRADRARFWAAYRAARLRLPTTPAMARDLEAATAASNHRFWARRVSRYRSDNREFRRVKGGYAVRDFPADALRAWLADPDDPFDRPGVVRLKDSRSSTVVAGELPDGRRVVLKRFRWKGWPSAGKNLFRASPALRSWLLGHGLRDRGLPTARPVAVFHRRRLGVPAEGYIAFEWVDGVGLAEAGQCCPDRLGRLLRDLHDRQVSHRDLKAANILLADAGPVLIDLVGVTAGRGVRRSTRVRDLARLNASFWQSAQVSRTDRLRVLRAYLRWGLHGRGDWKRWWNEVAAATRAKAAKNEKNGRVLA